MASTLVLFSFILSRWIHRPSDNDAIIQHIGDQLIQNGEYAKCYRLSVGIQRQAIDLHYDPNQYRRTKQRCILYQIQCLLALGHRQQAVDTCLTVCQQSPSALWYLLAADIYIQEHLLDLALFMVRKSMPLLSGMDPIWSQVLLQEQILCQGVLLQRDGGEKETSTTLDMTLVLPFDIVLNILSLLPLKSIVRCARLDRRWNNLINSTRLLWQRLDFSGNSRPLPMTTFTLYLSRLHGVPLLSVRMPNPQCTQSLLNALCKANCSQLYKLEFTFMPYATKQGWDSFCQLMQLAGKTLRVLRLWCGDFRLANIIDWVASTCHQLDILDLRHCFSLQEADQSYEFTLEHFGARLPCRFLDYAAELPTLSIHQLVLTDLFGLSNSQLALVLLRCPNLVDLTLLNGSINIIPVINLLSCLNTGLERLHYEQNETTQARRRLTQVEISPPISCSVMASLKHIAIKQTLVDDTLLHHLLQNAYDTIDTLDLKGNGNLTDTCLYTMIQLSSTTKGLRVTDLCLASCVELTFTGLATFFRHTPYLINLDLSCQPHVTDHVLYTLALHCPRLLNLNLSHCSAITDTGIRRFIDTLGMTLQSLGLVGTGLCLETLAYVMCHVQHDGI